MHAQRSAAVVTVGTEITAGLRLDTNTREIATSLLKAGYTVAEAVSLPDDMTAVARTLQRLVGAYELVMVTGGLGPTHDDITRDAAAEALGLPLVADPALEASLAHWASRQASAEATAQVLRQALILEGARFIPPITGTAPGQIVVTRFGSTLVLLPGPPHEMAPMVVEFLGEAADGVLPRELSCTGLTESDAQIAAQEVLSSHPGVDLALLAKPGDLRVVLLDAGAGAAGVELATAAVRSALGDACYADDGSTLAESVIRLATSRNVTLATAESCTGGLVGAALTSVSGSSAVFMGGMITYANEAKASQLGVSPDTLTQYGAVSAESAGEMALGVRERFEVDVAVSVTGVAGPTGGTQDKPVGLVWYGIATPAGTTTLRRIHPGDREGVRERATITALHLFWQTLSRM